MVDAALLNAQLRDPLELLETHNHNGAVGTGAAGLVGVNSITLDDTTPPSAPAATKTTFYSASGRPGYIPNGGSATPLSDLNHASLHNSGGADAVAVNGAAGTPTLRKLGLLATDAAPGDHSIANGGYH